MFLIRTGREQCNRGGVDKFSREIIIIVEGRGRKEGRKNYHVGHREEDTGR